MGAKILIVDDEADFCRLVKLNLGLMGGFEVSTAKDGEEGIKLAREVKPDLILLDVLLPGINGFEVFERLKKDNNTGEIPVIMLTAKVDQASKERIKELHCDGYLNKPAEALELKAKIDEVLKKRRAK